MTTKSSRTFQNSLGIFEYSHCSNEYFPIGIRQISNTTSSFLIASAEKALCDLIINTSNLNMRYEKEILAYLEQDLRIDMDGFYKMDINIFNECLKHGKKKTTITQLIKILSNE